jgi:hypothetical protein
MSLVIDSPLEVAANPWYGYRYRYGYGNVMIAEVFQKKMAEIKRNHLYREFRRAMKDYKEGKVKTGTVSDLFNSIK